VILLHLELQDTGVAAVPGEDGFYDLERVWASMKDVNNIRAAIPTETSQNHCGVIIVFSLRLGFHPVEVDCNVEAQAGQQVI
jgi:hypothetical protein